MSQGRYVWIAGKKVYLNPELQKEWDKLINKERYRARQEKICGQADYRRCNGDCFVCPWRKEIKCFWTSQRRQASRGKGSKNVSCSLRIWREIGRLERKLERKEREQRATHTRLVLVKQMR